MEKAYFAGGCFWGVEASFRKIDGVTETSVGYAGGFVENPSYEAVCKGDTEHAETVEVAYDADKVSLETLMDVFFTSHNPTQKDRQGPDVGRQYRTAIFTLSDDQADEANAAIARHQPNFAEPIVTEVTGFTNYWLAEEYHQQYFEKRGISGGCQI